MTNDDVYLAGTFLWVGDEERVGFAAVDANTGAVDSGFIMNVENSEADGQIARGIVVTNDGNSVFGLHFGTSINGETREALVKIDTSGNTAGLADWRVDWSGQSQFPGDCLRQLRDIAIAPDDSFIVIGGQGGDRPPNCDSVLRYPTDGTGVIGFDWSARLYSSIFSLAVSDTAVYVGGHFCAAPLNGADPESRQTHERPNGAAAANRCAANFPNDPVNPSVIFPNDAVFRSQLAALDPSDGRALAWDPGSNASLGTFDLTIIERGLLAGMDRDRYGNFILTGRSGFFDFGGFTPPAPPPPAPVVAACVLEVINNVPVVSYSDFTNVSILSIRRNGTFIDLSSAGTGTYEDTSAVPGVAYSYEVRSRPGGVVTDVACSPATITIITDTDAPTAEATSPADGSDDTVPDFTDISGIANDDISGISRVRVRVQRLGVSPAEFWNGAAWVTVSSFRDTILDGNGTSTTWTLPQVDLSIPGNYRVRVISIDNEGNVSQASQNPRTDFTVSNPVPGEKSCSVSLNDNNEPVLSYSGFTDVSDVQFRRNNVWIGSGLPGAGTFDDTSAVPGVPYSYVVRSRPGGVVTDLACTPAAFTF